MTARSHAGTLAPAAKALSIAWPFLVAAAVYLLWNTPVVYPLRIFTVFLHELSHGLAALLTGGAIERIDLTPAEGGLCRTRGGWPFVVTSAGYLGSLLFGALFVVIGGRARPATQRGVVGAIGILLLAATLLWVRTGFGLAWGILTAASLLATARWLPPHASVLVLRVLGVTSGLYAIWDIASDLVVRSVPSSDANAVARMTGIPGLFWGLLWGAVAVIVMARAVRAAVGGRSPGTR